MESNKTSRVAFFGGVALALVGIAATLLSGLPTFWLLFAVAIAVAVCFSLAAAESSAMASRPKSHKALACLAASGIVALIMYKPLAAQYKKEQKEGYQATLRSVEQYETQAGYVLQLEIKSTSGAMVTVPTDDFRVTVVRDEQKVEALSPEERKKLLYGITAKVFDSKLVLDAAIDGRSYANASTSIAAVEKPQDLFLLLTAAGPGSPNPSMRLQGSRIYRSVKVGLSRDASRLEELEVPLRHVTFVAADTNTQVIDATTTTSTTTTTLPPTPRKVSPTPAPTAAQGGTVVSSQGQMGGQTAGTIYNAAPADDSARRARWRGIAEQLTELVAVGDVLIQRCVQERGSEEVEKAIKGWYAAVKGYLDGTPELGKSYSSDFETAPPSDRVPRNYPTARTALYQKLRGRLDALRGISKEARSKS